MAIGSSIAYGRRLRVDDEKDVQPGVITASPRHEQRAFVVSLGIATSPYRYGDQPEPTRGLSKKDCPEGMNHVAEAKAE